MTINQLQATKLNQFAPGAMDTLKELADELGDGPKFRTTMFKCSAGKAEVQI